MSGRTAPKAKRTLKRDTRSMTSPLAVHRHQPAGTKLMRKFMKARTGEKAESGAEARAWYRAYKPALA